MDQAEATLRHTMLSHRSLLPHVLGIDQEVIDRWYSSNLVDTRYLAYVPESILTLWEPPAVQWADTIYHSEPMRRVRERSIEIDTQRKNEPRGPRRSQLIEEASQLPHGLPDSC